MNSRPAATSRRWSDRLAARLAAGAVIAAIGLYQRWLSPHKGFACAYRVHTGRASCSTLAGRAVRRHGAWGGLGVLRVRLACCAEAHARHHPPRRAAWHRQRGACDAGCDLPCDGPDLGQAIDCCQCGDCGHLGDRLADRRRRRRASG